MRRASGGVLHAVGSRTARSARALANVHGVTHVVTDLAALIEDPQLDIVYLATPHHLHAQDAVRCLNAGKAVLCEKPLALNATQVGEITASAQLAKRFCMEAMWTRFIPAVQHAMQLVRDGAVGQLVAVSGDFSQPVAYQPDSRFYSQALAGGALLDRGVYLISLAQALLGEPVRVQARVRKAPTGVDAHSAYLLEFANGVIGQFSASLTVRGSNTFTIEGDRGRIVLQEPFVCAHRLSVERYVPYSPRVAGLPPASGVKARLKTQVKDLGLHRRLDGLRTARRYLSSQTFAFPGNGYQFELDAVMQCLREGQTESAVMPLTDSLAIARTMDRIQAAWD
jgi:predicted dehydrogenase